LPPSHLQTDGVQQTNTRDALLLSLLSSEAMVESREYEILSAEEVEELKKVRAIQPCQYLYCMVRAPMVITSFSVIRSPPLAKSYTAKELLS